MLWQFHWDHTWHALKNTLFDSVSTGVLTFLLSLPTIALVYIIRLIGSEIGLPDSFPILGAGDWRSYVLPSVILGLLSTPGLAIWIRRYMMTCNHRTSFVLHVPKGCQNKKFRINTFSKMLWFPWFQESRHLSLVLSQGNFDRNNLCLPWYG